jgi:hypothetical protein
LAYLIFVRAEYDRHGAESHRAVGKWCDQVACGIPRVSDMKRRRRRRRSRRRRRWWWRGGN